MDQLTITRAFKSYERKSVDFFLTKLCPTERKKLTHRCLSTKENNAFSVC